MISTENTAKKEIKRTKELARLVIAHHFGNKKPRRIEHKASGLSNFVFAVSHMEGEFIVRISPDPTRINSFIKEQWAQGAASNIGVPVPEILEVGSDIIHQPFMISRTVEGKEATSHPKRLEILREMGRLAALINTIKTDGFGATFDWSSNQLSRNESWLQFLEKELNFEARLETLEKRKMITPAHSKDIHKTLTDVGKAKQKPSLTHGDIRLKNVMVDEAGKITALLDWEHCTSNLAPFWELSIALHDLSIDEKQEFLEGYNLDGKNLLDAMPLIKAINLINYAPEIENVANQKDNAKLEQYRVRLSGVLDFYSF